MLGGGSFVALTKYLPIYRRNKSDDSLYLYIKNLENSRLKPGSSVTNIHLNLWGLVENSAVKTGVKTGVKCAY